MCKVKQLITALREIIDIYIMQVAVTVRYIIIVYRSKGFKFNQLAVF